MERGDAAGSCRSFYSDFIRAGDDDGGGGGGGVLLTRDPKPRLRWTPALHDRFVEAVTILGGPDKATPKSVLKVMGTKGLTLYHLKSHLQKYRLGKQARKDVPELKDGGERSRGLVTMSYNSPVTACNTPTGEREALPLTEALRYQIEVQRKLREQLEVQKKLQMRIEAQGKYLQTILEKAHNSFSFGTMMEVEDVEKGETTDGVAHRATTVFQLYKERDGERGEQMIKTKTRSADERSVSLDLNVNHGSDYEMFAGFRPCDLQLGMQPRT